MKLYDVSQLPVIDGEKVAGIVDESDILLRVYEHEERFREPVRTAMTDRIETEEATGDLAALLPILAREHVARVKIGRASGRGGGGASVEILGVGDDIKKK